MRFEVPHEVDSHHSGSRREPQRLANDVPTDEPLLGERAVRLEHERDRPASGVSCEACTTRPPIRHGRRAELLDGEAVRVGALYWRFHDLSTEGASIRSPSARSGA